MKNILEIASIKNELLNEIKLSTKAKIDKVIGTPRGERFMPKLSSDMDAVNTLLELTGAITPQAELSDQYELIITKLNHELKSSQYGGGDGVDLNPSTLLDAGRTINGLPLDKYL